MRISSITKNAGKACNNRLYRHIRTFEKIVKNYFVILYRFCYIFHYPVFIFALSKIFLFLYCCFCYPFHFLADLQLHDGRLMFHCRNNLLHQIFCPKSETRCIDAWMTSYIFSCKHIFIDQKPYHPVLIIHQSKHT